MSPSPVQFHKLHGCGNDFIVIDNRTIGIPQDYMAGWAVRLCDRKLAVGADGLVFLENTPADRQGEYIWHFYNADGSRAEMCGNASRCVSWLAVDLGLAGIRHSFGTDAGLIHAEVDYQGRASKVELTPPRGLALDTLLETSAGPLTVHFVDTGVPHAVVLLPDNSQTDVAGLGRELRHHPHFAPAGTNVNFISVAGGDALHVRTYERGVEAETLACGTGAAASALVAHALGLTGSAVSVTTSGGEVLGIELRQGAVFLSGAVTRVFTGVLDPVFLSLS